MTDRKKRGVAFWATVAMTALILYVASFGPACWHLSAMPPKREYCGGFGPPVDHVPHAPRAYWPIGLLMKNGPKACRRMLTWYGTQRTEYLAVPTNLSGSSCCMIGFDVD